MQVIVHCTDLKSYVMTFTKIKHTQFFIKFPLLVTGPKISIQPQHYILTIED